MSVSPLFTLLVQAAVVVTAARVVGALFRRVGQAAVVGEMAAGLMLGPSLLGRFAPEAFGFLFPASSLNLLNAVSQFGLVIFLFLVGSRLDLGHLRANSRIVVVTSYVSMLLPFALGTGFGFLVSAQFGVHGASLVPFVLFIGLSLSVTAFPVLVRIVDAHALTSTRLGTIAIACAAFDDVTAWIALAFVTTLAHTGQVQMAGSLLRLAAYAVAMLFLVRPLLRSSLRRLGDTDSSLAVLLVAALTSAAVTEWLGIHALFGSFFLGAVMSREIADQHIRTDRLEPLTVTLFVPLFFAFTGLRTQVGLIASPALAAETLAILAIAIIGKSAGPVLTGRRLGLSQKETMALGALLNTRGLVELVVLNIGLEAGLLSPVLFTMLTLMALATTAMTSPILEALGYSRR